MPIILAVLLPVILALQAMAGHAAGLARHTALALVVDTLHLLAASVWVGGLLALTVGLLPLVRRNRTDFSALAHAGWGRFGRWAAASVAVLFATGLYSAGRQVTSVDALLTTLYGQTLLVKMGLVLGVGLIGLTNATLLHPILARLFHLRLSLRPLPRLVSFEIGLGLLVIMATGLLTASPQANGPEFGPTNAELPQSLSQTAHDMVITFGAKPNRPGQNVFTIRAASTRRPAPAEVMRVMVRLTYLAQDIGRVSVDAVEVEPGLYQVGGNYFSAAGPWQVNVVARRRGVEDVTATFNWVVPPVGSGRAPFISSRPLEPGLTTAAALLLLALAAFLLGLAARRAGMEMWPLRKLTNFLTGFRLNIKTFAPIPVPKEKENR
jgi:copper transport protein